MQEAHQAAVAAAAVAAVAAAAPSCPRLLLLLHPACVVLCDRRRSVAARVRGESDSRSSSSASSSSRPLASSLPFIPPLLRGDDMSMECFDARLPRKAGAFNRTKGKSGGDRRLSGGPAGVPGVIADVLMIYTAHRKPGRTTTTLLDFPVR